MDELQTQNLIGVLALAVSDRMQEAVTEDSGHASSGAAALSVLHHILSSPSIETLGRALGLTSSGTVRLVDRLADVGLVRRMAGPDGRVTNVMLTGAGRRVSNRVTSARTAVLQESLAVLNAEERVQLGTLAARVLVGMVRVPGAPRWTCRSRLSRTVSPSNTFLFCLR